ncbi:hypothetical protein C9374_008463 [Naegleria lovaniensis]|uniref:Uncharacterized protein n=1 Tax=Naegleria lovaniensis TaxID=51637 RepID=A0AA88GK97_NAELO|nr:uncharacterized protein C9374_008463 [Naegleria lovaniensis]KAG2378320.1 hypothetical protein C9374_008463 [Naegleria lovaniensis]
MKKLMVGLRPLHSPIGSNLHRGYLLGCTEAHQEMRLLCGSNEHSSNSLMAKKLFNNNNLNMYGSCLRKFSMNFVNRKKNLFDYETDMHKFFTQKNQILESPKLTQHYENVLLELLDCPTNVKYHKSTYFVASFIIECIDLLNMEKDREFLLLKAWDLLNAGTFSEVEIPQKNALQVQLATLLQDIDKMAESFDVHFNYIKQQLVQHRQLKKPLQIPLDDIVIGFSCAPHVGKYAEMSLLGDLIVNVYKAPELLEVLNTQANTDQQLDYSAIYNILKAYPIPNEPIQREPMKKLTPISGFMKITSMTCWINDNKEDTLVDDTESITLGSNDLLELHQWGNVILWFQQIVLSGIIGEDKAYLYGYAHVDGIDSNNFAASSNVVLEELIQSITNVEMKQDIEGLIKEGKEANASTVSSCVIETQYQFENASSDHDLFSPSKDDMSIIHWKGVLKKTVTETHKTRDVVKITTSFHVEVKFEANSTLNE